MTHLVRRRVQALVGRVRIRGKILGIAAGSVVLLGAVLTFSARESTRNTLRGELRAKAVSIARQFAAADTDAVLTNDLFSLHRSLQDGLKADPDLTYAFIHAPGGQIIADTFTWGFPPPLTALTRETTHSQVVPIETEDGIVWDASAPMLDGGAGWTHVGLSERRIRATVNRTTRDIALLTLLVAAVASLGAFGLATVLSAPILRLRRAAENVAAGDLDQEVEVTATDETGELTHAFNAMTRQLADSRHTLVRQNRDLRVLNAVASSVASATTLAEILDAALDSVRNVLGADGGTWVFLTDGESPHLTRHVGLPAEIAIAEASAPFEDCSCLDVLFSGQAMVVRDLPLTCCHLPAEILEGSGLRCRAAVPIRSRGRVLGVLNVASRDPLRFDEDETRLLEAVGSALGVAVDNAGLWEEVRRRDELRGRLIDRILEAQEEERRRIAREIHDHTNQVLSALIVSVDVAQRALADRDERVAAVLGETRAECEEILERLDELVLELRPKLLDDLGLPAALEWLTQKFGTRAGVKTRLEVAGIRARIAPDVETAAFRIVQESLANIAKHADARHVAVDVRSADGLLDVLVVDDGRGFDPARVDGVGSSHFGLLGMRERAAVAGGTLQVTSEPGRGARVHVCLPVRGGDE